jgi:hypothetical protein
LKTISDATGSSMPDLLDRVIPMLEATVMMPLVTYTKESSDGERKEG